MHWQRSISAAGGGGSKLVAEQAFSLQYTALILIILTFVIGAFVRPHHAPAPELYTSPHVPLEQPVSHNAGTISYSDLFFPRSSRLNPAASGAILQFLSNHDVEAEIDVFGAITPDEHDDQTALNLSLARSAELLKLLTEGGVPPAAVRIYAEPFGIHQVSMTITRRSDGTP